MSTFEQDFQKALAAARGKDSAYNTREMANAQKRLHDLRKDPLPDRKEAQESYLRVMRDNPDILAERVQWIVNGDYGYGEKLKALQILENKRMNRTAALAVLAAGYEWQCPEDMAVAAWKKLTKPQQATLDRHLQEAVKKAERHLVEE